MSEYGAPVERGIILEATGAGYKVQSLTRDGITSPDIPAIGTNTFSVGDKVFFFLFDDGGGGVLSAFD